MRRLSENPIDLFTGRIGQSIPTFFAQAELKKDFSGFHGIKNEVIMMEVCNIESQTQFSQPTDEDMKLNLQITNQSTNQRKGIDDDIVLWSRNVIVDLGDGVGSEGGAIHEDNKRDDLTIANKGELWPVHKLFIGVDTDIGAELITVIVRGRGFLVAMSPLEAWINLKRFK